LTLNGAVFPGEGRAGQRDRLAGSAAQEGALPRRRGGNVVYRLTQRVRRRFAGGGPAGAAREGAAPALYVAELFLKVWGSAAPGRRNSLLKENASMKVSRNAVLGLSIALALAAGIGQASAQETTPAASSTSMKSDTQMKKDSMKSNDSMKSSDSMSSGDSMKSDTGAKPHHKKGHKKTAEPASSSTAGH
jgi:hypothetical protein